MILDNSNDVNKELDVLNKYMRILIILTVLFSLSGFLYVAKKKSPEPHINQTTNISLSNIKSIKTNILYHITYEDKDHILQKITLPEELLFPQILPK